MASDFSDWIGNSQTTGGRLDPGRSNALQTALGIADQAQDGNSLPMLHHWLYFWDMRPPSELGQDGHPAKGGFLPPIPLPRRMWAGGRLDLVQPLHFGEEVTKTSTIHKITVKEGRSGTLIFVTVLHEFAGESGLAIREEQDLVYRGEASGLMPELPQPLDTPPECDLHQTVMPDSVLLFRYSALTMNGHRIHYDQPYALEQEHYPALVVHGPLQASLLAMQAKKLAGTKLRSFTFRGQSPAYAGLNLHICGKTSAEGIELWTQQGMTRNMVANATV